MQLCKVCCEEHKSFLRGRNGGPIGIKVVVHKSKVYEAALGRVIGGVCGGGEGMSEVIMLVFHKGQRVRERG